MATITWEYVQIQGDNITPARLLWRRYKRPGRGMLGLFLDANPELSAKDVLGAGPFLPVGAVVRIPIDTDLLAGKPPPLKQIRLYGEA
jgi:phage tail protein X